MNEHFIITIFASTWHPRYIESLRRICTATKKLIFGSVLLIAMMLLASCSSKETLFKSNFDSTPINQPPTHVQEVGTVNIHGPVGSVKVVEPPVTPSGKWVQVSRPNDPTVVAGMQCNFSDFRGDGNYTFSATLFIPTGSGIATIQFEPFNQPVGTLTSFLHLDFTQDNRIRIDDKDDTKFGTFPRNQPFIVQVTLNINASSATTHILLSGAGASGEADYSIIPALHSMAREFGAVRLWMGFPHTGTFDATNIVVTRKTD
jgi:hypothetical protein